MIETLNLILSETQFVVSTLPRDIQPVTRSNPLWDVEIEKVYQGDKGQ